MCYRGLNFEQIEMELAVLKVKSALKDGRTPEKEWLELLYRKWNACGIL